MTDSPREHDQRPEPGVCPECNGDRRGVYAYGCWYTCDACKGTGRQPAGGVDDYAPVTTLTDYPRNEREQP